jgi:hypothetical protein
MENVEPEWTEFTREEYPVLLADSIGCSASGHWAPYVRTALDSLNRLTDTYPNIRVIQVKEKFGTLRTYTSIKNGTDPVPEEVLAEIEATTTQAEKNCANTCVECGSHDDVKIGFRTVDSGWLLPLCKEHRCTT